MTLKFTLAPDPEFDAREAGRLLFAGPVDFVKGVVAMSGLPAADRLEVCFAGRSNVGKSSLINALTGRKSLARASNTPGRTQEINFFALGEQRYLVDLPGYGYAEAPKPIVAKWQALLKSYLAGRQTLRRAFVLVDTRHGVKAVDEEILTLLDRSAVTFQVVMTKADKVLKADRDAAILQVQGALAKHAAAYPEIVVTSSEKGDGIETLRAMIAGALGVTDSCVTLGSDVEIAYQDVYAPGEGYLVYAGTGSIAAFIDETGCLHRAGGHGVLLDDAGGGFWIAREALRHIWRNEDARPDCWRESAMAREIFARIGGNDWAHTRNFVYGSSSDTVRGEIGKLALAVAAVADVDPDARRILETAGEELARLGRVMTLRFGPRPVTLSGRVAQLHPVIAEAMRAALRDATPFQVKTSDAHVAAARIAARSLAEKDD